MSVIYATLERLESENPDLTRGVAACSPGSASARPREFPLRTLAALVLLFCIAGLALMFNQPETAVSSSPAPPALDRTGGEARTAKVRVAQAPITVAAIKPLPPAQPAGESFTEQQPVVAATLPAEQPLTAEEHGSPREDLPAAPRTAELGDPLVANEVGGQLAATPLAQAETVAAIPAQQPLQQAPVTAAVQADGVDEAIESARRALSAGRYWQALSALDSLEPVPETRADFWLIKGSAHLANGQLDLADAAFASAQSLAPENAQIAIQSAIVQQERGDHASALKILEDLATRYPTVPEVFLNQGYSHQAMGAVSEARHSFHTFLRMTEGRSLYSHQRKVVRDWLAQVSSV